jgi:hypothetical protein
MNTKHIDKFLGYVVKGNTEDECWNWTACKDKDGYGRIRINKRLVKCASRFSYEYYNNNDTPIFEYIYHTCKNKSCVNPNHLKTAHEIEIDDWHYKIKLRALINPTPTDNTAFPCNCFLKRVSHSPE